MILVPFPYVDVLLSVPTGHQLSITHSTPILDITHTLQEHLTAFVSIISVLIGVLIVRLMCRAAARIGWMII